MMESNLRNQKMILSNPMFKIITCLIGILLSSCTATVDDITSNDTPGVFSIIPKEISLEKIFSINIPERHPSKISVRTPSNEWYVIHDLSEKVFVLPAEEYISTKRIDILPSHLMGVTWKDGKRVVGMVFSRPGEYLIYMADNLETEPENTFHFMGKVFLKYPSSSLVLYTTV